MGITLKFADYFGEQKRSNLAYVFAGLAAVCLSVIVTVNSSYAAIFFGIMLGVTLAGKLDQLNMVFGVILTIVLAFFFGFQIPDISLLIISSIAALLDEIGHGVKGVPPFLLQFFRYRMILKVIIILLAISMWIHYYLAVGFFCFDLSYDLVNLWISSNRTEINS
jgi:hypothetical protein